MCLDLDISQLLRTAACLAEKIVFTFFDLRAPPKNSSNKERAIFSDRLRAQRVERRVRSLFHLTRGQKVSFPNPLNFLLVRRNRRRFHCTSTNISVWLPMCSILRLVKLPLSLRHSLENPQPFHFHTAT